MKPGTQIAYVPDHANGNLAHPDVEFGFVVAEGQHGIDHFCRYWRKGKPGILRTRANSELTFNRQLVEHTSVEQSVVDEYLYSLGLAPKYPRG